MEAGVKYVKRNFLPLRTFRELADLNQQARRWVLDEAGTRLHGTTREAPLARFERERPLMRPLPPIAPDLGVWARVKMHRDCHVQFERSLYSVPFTLVGQTLWLRATDTSVSIYESYRLIAQHLRARAHGTRRTVREHLPPQAQAFFLRDRHWCDQQAQQIGPACAELVGRLLADRIVERLRAAQGVIGLAARFDPALVDAACRRALEHDSPHYRTVKTLLMTRLPWRKSALPAPDTPSAAYIAGGRFVRPARSMFSIDGDRAITVEPSSVTALNTPGDL